MTMNGQGKMTGWVIAILGERALVGRQREGELSPVFDLRSGIQLGPQGQLGRPCIAAPVLGFASIKSLPLPNGAILIPVVELSRDDQRAIEQAVAMGAEIQSKMLAVDAGILIAPSGTKLPPMPGA